MLINNAGIGGNMEHGPMETEMRTLREAFEVNLFGTFDLTRGLLPLIKENEGIILNVTMEMASLSILSQGILITLQKPQTMPCSLDLLVSLKVQMRKSMP